LYFEGQIVDHDIGAGGFLDHAYRSHRNTSEYNNDSKQSLRKTIIALASSRAP
jgi:hypothetical protein